MIQGVNQTTELIIGVCTAIVLLAGAYKVLWHGRRRGNGHRDPGLIKAILRDLRGGRDALLGRDAVVDTITGEERVPALPGIGVRMAHQEQQMELLTEAVAKLASTHTRLENHETRILKLEEAAVERVVTRAESAAAWRAMEAAALATPDEEPNQS